MPHFGLMDESGMKPLEAELLRAKLHIRCGRRRLSENKTLEAISTLYDALLAGMRWYALANDPIHQDIHQKGDTLLEDDLQLHNLLAQHGAWPESVSFHSLQATLYKSLDGDLSDFDRSLFWKQIEMSLTQLGIMPFDETTLPPEDPTTF